MKIRQFKDKNYKAIFHNGKTLRIALDPKKPIKELDYPEFYDVKITNFCEGNCRYCYQDSKNTEKHFENILGKTKDFFGKMNENQKPFQVAIGGGNPNQHPDFIELLKLFSDLGILPNYTTNGMGLTDEILEATQKYCGGVAVSCHPHLATIWKEAIQKLSKKDIPTNLHIIISDKDSVDSFIDIYNNTYTFIDYFVLLPYTAQGRAVHKEIEYDYLMDKIVGINKVHDNIAFGANFYPLLQKNCRGLDVSLYEPEIMSKYLDMSDMKLYKSSFNLISK